MIFAQYTFFAYFCTIICKNQHDIDIRKDYSCYLKKNRKMDKI